MVNLPPDFFSQVLRIAETILKILSPVIFPVLGLLIFIFAVKIIIGKLLHPTSVLEGVRKKILLGLLFSAISAFLVWLYQQPEGFRQGILLPFQFLYSFITMNKALTTLATALIGIILTAILL